MKEEYVYPPLVFGSLEFGVNLVCYRPGESDTGPNGLASKPSYAQSPAAHKRKKMEDLAEARAQKRSRR